LDICQGRTVRIHENAWESVRPLIAELQVSISDNKDHAAARDIASGEAQSSNVHEPHDQAPSHEDVQDDERSEDIYEDFLEDKMAAMSSFAGSAAESDDEREFHRSEGNISNRSAAIEHHPTDQEDEGDEVASATAHHIKTEPALSERLSQDLGEYIDRDLMGVGRAPASGSQPDGQPAERPIKDEQLSARGLPAAGSGGAIASSQSQTQLDADDEAPKYVVNIEYRPKHEESMFKTRGTYSVKKVLARACESFGLDFDRAHLKLIVGIDDEGGGELLSDCDNGDTMSRAGAVANSRFIIVMDED